MVNDVEFGPQELFELERAYSKENESKVWDVLLSRYVHVAWSFGLSPTSSAPLKEIRLILYPKAKDLFVRRYGTVTNVDVTPTDTIQFALDVLKLRYAGIHARATSARGRIRLLTASFLDPDEKAATERVFADGSTDARTTRIASMPNTAFFFDWAEVRVES